MKETTSPEPRPPEFTTGSRPDFTLRLGLIADLAFVFGVVWLALWRGELFGASPGSIWGGWWPALVLAGLIVVAVLIGLAQPRPRGFLPYWLRWCLLTASLVLPAWIVLSLVDGGDEALTIESAARDLRRSAEEALAQEPHAQDALAAAEAAEKLASVIETAEKRGIEVPKKDLEKLGLDPADVAALAPVTRKTLEHAAGIAAVQSGEMPAPAGFSALAEEFGLNDPLIQKALIALVAAALAPVLGLSPALVKAVLAVLLAEGLSGENLLQVGLALAVSGTRSGTISAAKFNKNYALLGQGSAVLRKLHDAFAAKGVDPARLEFLDSQNKSREGAACRGAVRKRGEADEAFHRRLRQACPQTSPAELDAIVKESR